MICTFVAHNIHSIFFTNADDPVSSTADSKGVEPSPEVVSHACTLCFDHFEFSK